MNIKTVFKKRLYENEEFKIFTDTNGRVFKGEIPYASEEILNIPVEVEVDKTNSSKYGTQYVIKDINVPNGNIYFFLKNIIGSLPLKTIKEIINRWNEEEILKIIQENPDELKKIKGIGEKRTKLLKENFNKYKHLLELSKYLSPYGVSSMIIQKIYKKFGENSINVIKNNIYAITEIKGIGFKKADEIALKVGVKPEDDNRIKSAIEYVLKNQFDTTGDTIIKKEELIKKVKELNINNEIFIKMSLNFNEKLEKIEKNKETWVSFKVLARKEKTIYHYFNDVKLYEWKSGIDIKEIKQYVNKYEKTKKITFSKKQRKAIIEFTTTQSPIFILAGYAGSGKTTTSKTIMDLYSQKYGKDAIVACALSGNASNRIKIVSGYKAFTIHSLLGFNGKEFVFDEYNPLPYKLIVLDEASMVDVELFYRLLKAIDFSKSKLFIIGDNAQIPPVGKGEPFNDILEKSNVPIIVLDEVFRQSEEQVINVFAQTIRKGQAPKNFIKKYDDFLFYPVEKTKYEDYKKLNEDILKNMLNLYVKAEEAKERFVKKQIEKKADPKDIFLTYIFYNQIIVPQKKYELGTKNLNFLIKQLINPLTEQEEKKLKYVGNEEKMITTNDKVIHLVNVNKKVISYEKFIKKFANSNFFFKEEFDDDDFKEKRVFNGQMGVVIKIFNNEVDEDEIEQNYFAVYYPNENYVVIYSKSDFFSNIIDLSYAITIHKSQGSEYKNVFIPITPTDSFMWNNKLLYTAITRAKNYLCMVGDTMTFKKACYKKETAKRKTLYKLLTK